ncbi:DUF2461 domain-containing protein [Hymenobacter ginsengisoli]|uniref:DUF2461 domain-containing protein n=1 Tax=Hymenobacter ginsengisoli TaxID=1051626 RepID=A0ABP8QMV8_9BACT|nr:MULTISPECIES: DUF2461 domain-containing protein [unclassified Hymenobacter]MBO2031150.1 DUF2461 domain-containing protein [Hymenobacter sp. BT559]
MNLDLAFVLDFLRRLAANNNTAWMQEHRADYLRARGTFAALVAEVLRRATPAIPGLAGLTPAQAMFRLHKNDRSQTDPEPYKRRLGAGLVPGGRHALRAGYFLALMPGGGSWLRAGRFTPTPAELAAIRQEIHYDGAGFHRAIEDPGLLQHFPSGLDRSAEQLTRPPRGYQASDPDLAFLRLKSFGVVRLLADEEVLAPDFIDRAVAGMLAARPWVDFLNGALDA